LKVSTTTTNTTTTTTSISIISLNHPTVYIGRDSK